MKIFHLQIPINCCLQGFQEQMISSAHEIFDHVDEIRQAAKHEPENLGHLVWRPFLPHTYFCKQKHTCMGVHAHAHTHFFYFITGHVSHLSLKEKKTGVAFLISYFTYFIAVCCILYRCQQ